jgi:hypothetical protein
MNCCKKDFSVVFEYDIGRSVACDGKFLYLTNSSGCGLIKIGNGLHGTLRFVDLGFIISFNNFCVTEASTTPRIQS